MPNTKSYQKLDSTIQPQRPASSAAIAVAATLRCRFSTVTFITSISVATVVVVFVTVAAAEINTEIAVRKHQIAKKNRAPRDLSADRTTREVDWLPQVSVQVIFQVHLRQSIENNYCAIYFHPRNPLTISHLSSTIDPFREVGECLHVLVIFV